MTRELQDKAQEFMDRNEWGPAIQLLEQAREQEPNNPFVLGPLAFCLSRLKRHKEAIELFTRLCELQPEIARWPYSVGYQYYDQQQYAQAIEHFDRALEIEPNYIVVLYRKGYALSTMKGREGHALTAFEACRKAYHALTDEGEKDRERKNYADACYQQGKLFLSVGNRQLAEERLREAVELKKDDPNVHYILGKAYVESQRFDLAIDRLRTAQRLSKQPEHYILDYLARAYKGAGQLQKALEVYERMPAQIRSRTYILRNLGDVYIELEQWDEAERTLRDAVKREHRNHNGHFQLGLVLQHQAKWAEAAREFETAIELRKKHYGIPFPDAEQALQALVTEHPEAGAKTGKAPNKPAISPSGRPVARVEKYFDDRGFGFLAIEGESKGLFFHITDVQDRDSVEVGEYLEYSIGEGAKGPRAIELVVVE